MTGTWTCSSQHARTFLCGWKWYSLCSVRVNACLVRFSSAAAAAPAATQQQPSANSHANPRCIMCVDMLRACLVLPCLAAGENAVWTHHKTTTSTTLLVLVAAAHGGGWPVPQSARNVSTLYTNIYIYVHICDRHDRFVGEPARKSLRSETR